MTAPTELELDETLAFIAGALAAPCRVLEVGAGSGALAARLRAAGHEVTAIDPHVHDGASVLPHGVLEFEGGPFDAVLFTRSLHHIADLDAAVARAAALLVPGGLLVLDEFDVAAPDAPTAHWYYEVQELLAATGLYHAHEHHHGHEVGAPLDRWRAEHDVSPPLHPAAAMLRAIEVAFTMRATRLAYLYRYIWAGLPASAAGLRTAAAVRDAEQRRIEAGQLVPVGLRVVARRR